MAEATDSIFWMSANENRVISSHMRYKGYSSNLMQIVNTGYIDM